MKSVCLSLLIAVATTGCAHHFQRIKNDAVVLYLKAPHARSVRIAASYNGFVPQATERDDSGIWSVTMPKGQQFSYFYLVDDRIVATDCRLMEKDDFGQANCIFSPQP